MSNSTSSSAPASATAPGPHLTPGIPYEAVLSEVAPVSPGQTAEVSPTAPTQTGHPATIEEFKRPDFWPQELDPLDNQRVSQWLLGHGEWQGQEPGWKHYALDPKTAAMQPGTWAWRKKRAMDFSLTLLCMPLVLPIMGLVALVLFFTASKDESGNREPIFFKQWRPGYLCRPFQILKFRTMRVDGDSESPREDGQRLTSFGRFLRNTSLDELPQLVNILKGEMSLVGPRPQLTPYLARMTQEEVSRHGGLPGVSGLAQVEGRNLHSWSERFCLDLDHLNNYSIKSEFLILAKTVKVVIRRHGIQSKGNATNAEFLSTNIDTKGGKIVSRSTSGARTNILREEQAR